MATFTPTDANKRSWHSTRWPHRASLCILTRFDRQAKVQGLELTLCLPTSSRVEEHASLYLQWIYLLRAPCLI